MSLSENRATPFHPFHPLLNGLIIVFRSASWNHAKINEAPLWMEADWSFCIPHLSHIWGFPRGIQKWLRKENPSANGWFGGTPISGNHRISHYIISSDYWSNPINHMVNWKAQCHKPIPNSPFPQQIGHTWRLHRSKHIGPQEMSNATQVEPTQPGVESDGSQRASVGSKLSCKMDIFHACWDVYIYMYIYIYIHTYIYTCDAKQQWYCFSSWI